jgi:prolipoprotein diacylglyceryltransferase
MSLLNLKDKSSDERYKVNKIKNADSAIQTQVKYTFLIDFFTDFFIFIYLWWCIASTSTGTGTGTGTFSNTGKQ